MSPVVLVAQNHEDTDANVLVLPSGWRGYHRRMADADGKPLDERLEEIGAQLAWVRDYL